MMRNPQDYVICAFCNGRGVDRFGVLSSLSRCSVCGGIGNVRVPNPRVPCACCDGHGVQPDTRLTCTGCRGAGAHTVSEPQAVCPLCSGAGSSPRPLDDLPCVKCRGAGVVQAALLHEFG